jgi:GNAT superfamily N-acetyltransferase
MEKQQRWIAREGNDEDMEGILSLRKIVFGEIEEDKLDPRFWRWQIKENPDGIAWIYLAEDGDKIVGHLADLPKRFSVQGRVVLGTLTHDMMVHPDYRRRGISNATARYGIQKVEREKRPFMTAYSIRVESLNSLIKAGWKEVVRLPVLVFPLRFYGIIDRYLHFKLMSLLVAGVARFFYFFLFRWRKKERMNGVEIQRIHALDEQFDLFWEKAISLFPILGVRDRNYLNWRYLQHPTRKYAIYRALQGREMKGYIVLRKVELLDFNSAVIVDLLALDDEILHELVDKGIEHSRQEGTDLLGFMVPKPHPYYQSLRKKGFLPSFETFHFLVYSQGKEEIFFDPNGWYVTWGDTDVI